MQKIAVQLGILFISILFPLSCLAASQNNLIAQVKLDTSYKPEYAVSITPPSGSHVPTSTANIILQMIAGSLIYAAGPLAVFMLAIGGLRYVVSHGDQNQMESAKKTIMWAIIGLVVIIVSFAIVQSVIMIIP
ncbi:pilin [Patescibacteria group bacterium]|nr:pilin [Patescibacteria group bacterium]MBU1706011.1 pilin [Patescibacteria group bacterium]MBU1953391.1 pilin [Patescibacteria group bacterium]